MRRSLRAESVSSWLFSVPENTSSGLILCPPASTSEALTESFPDLCRGRRLSALTEPRETSMPAVLSDGMSMAAFTTGSLMPPFTETFPLMLPFASGQSFSMAGRLSLTPRSLSVPEASTVLLPL